MKYALIALLICIVVYEVFEHFLMPLFWMIRYRKRKSAYGPSGMIGKKCRVHQWDGAKGKVWVDGALWNATSQSPLFPGDEPVIQSIEGLTLRVKPSERLPSPRKKNSDNGHAHDT